MRQTPREMHSGRIALIFGVLGFMAIYLSFCAGCAHATSLKVAQGAFVGASMADLHSTQLALSQGHREANPVMQHGWARVAFKVASVGIVLQMGQELEQRGHPTLARVFTTAAATAMAIISARNYAIVRGPR